jgi:hypothetical protein
MMSTPKLGSLLLGTTRPEELRTWYPCALARDHEGDGPIDVEPVAERPSGRFGTFVDPDGNDLQVIQFSNNPATTGH